MADIAEFMSIAAPAADTTTDTTTVESTDTSEDQQIAGEETTGEATDTESEGVEAEEEESEEPSDQKDNVKQIKAAIDAIKKSGDIKTAKLLNDAYFRAEAFKKELGISSLEEARVFKAAMDNAGGVEGIATLQSKANTLEITDANFAKGDPSVIEDMSEAYPDGFKKIVPQALDKLRSMDEKSFVETIRPAAVEFLENNGFSQAISLIDQALKEGDGATIRKVITGMDNWLKEQKNLAPKKQAVDPDREKFETERKEFETQKETSFRQGVAQAATTKYNSLITSTLEPYLKSLKLSPEAKSDAINAIYAEVGRLNKANTAYANALNAQWNQKGRDAKKIQAFIEANLEDVVPKAVKAVMNRRYKGIAPAPKTGSATSKTDKTAAPSKMGGNNTPIKLAKAPHINDLDMTKDKNQVLFITNKGYMRTGPHKGKLVTW